MFGSFLQGMSPLSKLVANETGDKNRPGICDPYTVEGTKSLPTLLNGSMYRQEYDEIKQDVPKRSVD